MNKLSLSVAFLVSIFGPKLQATTLAFSPGPSARVIASSAGVNFTSVTSGSVWLGTFATPGAFTANSLLDVSTNVANIISAGGWERFTFDTASATPTTQNAGVTSTVDFALFSGVARLGGGATDTTTGATKADFFNGKQVYAWIFNNDDPALATEMGIFTSTAWSPIPTNGTVGDSLALGTTTATTITAVGGAGSVFTGGTSLTNQLRLGEFNAIPEPSRLLLISVGFMGLVARRRR
jgi:hypothetical protein